MNQHTQPPISLTRAKSHPAMMSEVTKSSEQFYAGYNSFFLHLLEDGYAVIDLEAPSLFVDEFRMGWNTARMLAVALKTVK